MGAHSTIQIPLDVARSVYKDAVGYYAPELSIDELESFYDRALDDQLYNVVFGDWLVGPTHPIITRSDVWRWVTEYLEKNPDRKPGSAESEIRYLRELLNLLAPTTPSLDGPNWLTDTIDQIHEQLDERISKRLRKP
jgi:hypothetical protein